MVSGTVTHKRAMLGAVVALFWSTTCAAQNYVGAAACASCHVTQNESWNQGRHSKMVQPARSSGVRGDFQQTQVTLRGLPYGLREENGSYYITESYLTGRPQQHKVDYTLGNRRIQHYVTTLADGRIVVLPPSWDVERKQWFHNLDIVSLDETSQTLVQVWNKNCYSCHVSREIKGFNAERNTYNTTWADFGTNCERCHGPGSEHVNDHKAKAPQPHKMIEPQKLDAARSSMVCAQCHSAREFVAEGYTPGLDYNDYFLPILEYGRKNDKEPSYWPDGRTRRFSNDAIGLWQSQYFLKGGATCVGCHTDTHKPNVDQNATLRAASANVLCIRCHASEGANLTRHSHHAEGSAGTACVDCHMPRTVFSVKAEIRDHSMSVPVPENTIRFAIPNACNACHKDKSADWAQKQLATWNTGTRKQKYIRRAEVFTLARAGNKDAIEPLLAILRTSSEGPIVRANAAGHLSAFLSDPRVRTAMLNALRDRDSRVLATAAIRLQPTNGNVREIGTALVAALKDPIRSVRAGAAMSLLNMGVKDLPGADGPIFAKARTEAAARFAIQSDDASENFNAGKFFYLSGESARATSAFETATKLDPTIRVEYYLAAVQALTGQVDEARRKPQAIASSDPHYAEAQQLLQTLK